MEVSDEKLIPQLIDKNKKNTRGVPTMQFIENVEQMVNKYTAERLVEDLNQYLNKFKYMEAQIQRHLDGIKGKIPEMDRALESIGYLVKKDKTEPVKLDYMVSNNLWAKAEIEVPNSVFLWLGANVMCEYSLDEAKALLNQNLEKAKSSIKVDESDLDFVQDQITVCEVNIARVYNERVRRNQLEQRNNNN